ncbi:serine/threonine-protein kinase tefu isoform X2 [Rhodnius prolixus]|uniref:serine/threonine-protein kinase tefu isoform X2 n=1 Tax=Rhodnius prolixus TaxID=13249 RepID=UPI003D189C63
MYFNRKRVEEMRTYLQNPIVIGRLHNKIDSDKSSLNWNHLYQAVHRSILKEGERYLEEEAKGKTTNASFTALKNSSSLLILIASKANSDIPRLSCRDVISSVLEILENNCFRRISAVPYMTILNQYVLLKQRYWGEINLSQWIDLLDSVLPMFDETNSEKDKCIVIGVLNQVCLHGSRLADFMPHCKKVLKCCPEIIKQVVFSTKSSLLQSNVLQLALTLCKLLKKEYRLFICKFGEEVMDSINKMIESRAGDVLKTKELVANLTLELITVHHPCGISAKMPGSMVATSWNSWITNLRCLFFGLQNELDNLGHTAPSSDYPPIIALTVSVAKLIVNDTNENTDCNLDVSGEMSFNSPSVKRRKLTTNVLGIVDHIRCKKRKVEAWPWLLFIELLITKYPEILEEVDFISILQLVSDYLSFCPDKHISISLWRCAKALLLGEKQNKEITNVEEKQNLWTHVWSTALRDFSRPEINCDAVALHLFIQTALEINFSFINREKLVSLYTEQILTASREAVKTIAVLCRHAAIPDSSDKKISLLMQLLDKCATNDCAFAIDCSIASFGLLMKSKLPISIENENISSWDELDIFYMTVSLETLPSLKDFCKKNDETNEVSVIEDKKMCQEFIKLCKNLVQNIDESKLLNFCFFLHQLKYYVSKYDLSIKKEVSMEFQLICDRLWTYLLKELNNYEVKIPITLIKGFNSFVSLISDNPNIFADKDIKTVGKLLFKILLWHRESIHSSSQSSTTIEDNYDKEQTKYDKSSMEKNVLLLIASIGYLEAAILGKSITDSNLMKYCSEMIDKSSEEGFHIEIDILAMIVKRKSISDNLLEWAISLLKELCSIWRKHTDEFIIILQTLREYIQHLKKSNFKENHINFCELISRCSQFIVSKNFGPRLVNEFATVIGTMIKEDHDRKWRFSFSQGEPVLDVRFHLVEFLKSRFVEVRSNATQYVTNLFENQDDREIQSELFAKIISVTIDLFTVQGNLSETEVKEEGMIITSSVLRIILCLIVSSTYWRRTSLYFLFKLIYDKKINKVLALKILNQLAQKLNLTNVIIFLEQNLDFIAVSWHKDYLNFRDFPYTLLSCNSRKIFYTEYKTCLIPILLEKGDESTLKEICAEMEISDRKVVEECFPEAISYLLPKLGDLECRLQAQEMYYLIERIIGAEALKDLLSAELDKVLVSLHEKLHDETHFKELCSSDSIKLEFPQRTSSHIYVKGVTFTLEYLQKTSPDSSIPLLVFLCKEYPTHIHHMVYSLTCNIFEAATKEIKLLCFHQYATLCDNLAKNMGDLGTVSGYIIRSVVYTLLYLTDTNLTIPSLCFLNRFLRQSLSSTTNPESEDVKHNDLQSNRIVNNLLHVIVSKLVPMSNIETGEGRASLQILTLLLLTHKDSLPAVRELDPLPNEPIFSKLNSSVLRDSLVAELEHFLKVGQHQTVDHSTREYGLRHLHQQLINRKTELIELYSELKNMRGFAEDCEKSILHRTISSLVYFTGSANARIREVAGRCLGELGPRNLSTLALKPACSEKSTTLAADLLAILLPLMVHKNPNVAESCCEVLRSLLLTKEGHDAATRLSDIEASYLSPLLNDRRQKRPYSVNLCADSLKRAMRFWCPQDDSESHFKWISELTTALLGSFQSETCFFRLLIPVVQHEVKVAEAVLPYITYIVLKEVDDIIPTLQEKINSFFYNHFQLNRNLSYPYEKESKSIYMNRASLQCMLSVVNFYRQKEINAIQKFQQSLHLNYLHISKAAQYCRAYFTSIMYAELWTDFAMHTIENKNVSIKQRSPPLELVCEHLADEGLVLQNLLWDAYKEIGEPDAVYGCGNIHLHDSNGRIKYYKQLGLWSKIIEECTLNQDKLNNDDLVLALKMSGQYAIAMNVSSDTSERLEYDCAWRLGNWTLDVPVNDTADYSALLYGALKAVQMEDSASIKMFVDKARMHVLENLQHASLEVANSIYLPLSRLQALSEIEYICGNNNSNDLLAITQDCVKWEIIEPILVQRALLMDPAPQVWLDAARFQARHSSSYVLALSYLNKIMKMGTTGRLLHEAKLEEAQIVWTAGEHHRAKYLLKMFFAENDNLSDPYLQTALLTYGRWMAETKTEKPSTIIYKYFQKAASLFNENSKERLAAAGCIARYADSEFQRKRQYLESGEYAAKLKNIRDINQTFEELKQVISKDKEKATVDNRKVLLIHKAQAENDEEETQTVQKECAEYLMLAVKEYLKCLQWGEGDSNNLKMFRLVSLWFDNKQNEGVEDILDTMINEIPTYKFLPVLPQLAVRIAPMDGSHFLTTLKKLLIRCSEEHPHHSLPQLLALANSDKDEEIINQNIKTSNRKKKDSKVSEARVLGSQELLEILLKRGKIGELIKLLQILSVAYISLANCDISKNTKPGDYKIPANEPIRKLKRLSNMPCITLTVPVNKNGNYSNIIGIEKFDDVYTHVGGLNQPKKVRCWCTDGICRDQLVKGKDDLRQDAVMQQVFTIMNTLLRNDEKTANRKLTIRTYKVIPLSQRSGVIEWVKGTEPFGNYLCGSQPDYGAHTKYRPQDLFPVECRQRLANVADSSKDRKIQVFKEICARFKPVFRYFFFEKYSTPGEWFERRLAYTKSVATNSMIGYILGIGDRHVINILIDQITAEMVHIDFGIAFEQGKNLPSPEKVPFRLTRDVVDGMGVSGVEGVFRRCCEETMTVLRKCQEPILTTLEVLLYDPLYTWTVSTMKASSLREHNTIPLETDDVADRNVNKKNVLAERALQRLKEKLEGMEDGSHTSVEGQVNLLIRTARETSNLAVMYRGWQAYL